MTDLLAVMARPQTKVVATLLYEAGFEAGLERKELLQRASGLYVAFCAGSLCDDLMDGDVTYLANPIRMAPSAQYLLQHMGFAMLLDSTIARQCLRDAMLILVEVASYSHIEVRTTEWNEERYRQLSTETAGRQWDAYMRLLWSGTKLESLAKPFATRAAIAGYVSEDIRSGDPRYFSMTVAERRSVVSWAVNELRLLGEMPVACVTKIVASAAPPLSSETEKLKLQ